MDIQLLALPEFKVKIKEKLKPKKHKHFSKGSKNGNILMTRIRLGRSELNMHKFLIGQSESSECSCHFKNESSQHYFIDCFLYSSERQTLFNQVEQFIPKFKSLSKYKQHEIIINGINTNDPQFHYTNTSLSIAVQKFIFKSKRFQL